jgi:hypothetical protein
MRITINQLKRIIKEEVQRTLREDEQQISVEELAAIINADPKKFFSLPNVKKAVETASQDPTFVAAVEDAAEGDLAEGVGGDFKDKMRKFGKFAKRQAPTLSLAGLSAEAGTMATIVALKSSAITHALTLDLPTLLLALTPAAISYLSAAIMVDFAADQDAALLKDKPWLNKEAKNPRLTRSNIRKNRR